MSNPPGTPGPPDSGPVSTDPDDGAYHLEHDWNDSSPLSYTVLRAVAAITGNEPQELDMLGDAVDPDALDKLFDTNRAGPTTGRLRFEFNECFVTVFDSGHLVIVPPDRDSDGQPTNSISD